MKMDLMNKLNKEEKGALKREEIRLKQDARELGLSFDEVIFRLVPPEEIRDIAAFGLPNRYIHWVFGGQYKYLDNMEKKEKMSIQELVLNTGKDRAAECVELSFG